ncbi:hypothetical protein BO94DRAFT_216503 [Aspergillus sclerotioniger CBS 115572]|uniref:ATPase AAA-type core domain-containing protein n=1 Tax=Aspergillus sclerotioniger CBS 115572 TaxID=1450535 RepID=A0A317XBH0_9EURO|nr:hypothetical protein BO94DRAFT_216503 [Aspergillus sclerotioniger CBS 115572]PWY95032.1 hypothetical protein BO94DRAFT_216503 [Aspergillus sclerotioniger CBS 115572]
MHYKSGPMTGTATAFTAAVAFKLANPEPIARNMKEAILGGLEKACLLVSEGFKEHTGGQPFKYPQLSSEITLAEFNPPEAPVLIPSGESDFSILTHRYQTTEARLAKAKLIVTEGPEVALSDVPTAEFGKLLTVDREEMEKFRAIANLVSEYMEKQQTKPLSIGVFGRPGSGKSFGVEEVINAVAQHQGKGVQKLKFNLSQFIEYSDLLAAFQKVRDQTFSNKMPVVMFDEFDCSFAGKPLGWLQYFLAPMQDGQYLQHGDLRPLGSAIFIFVGGTSSTYDDFCATLGDREAVAAKKPDFASRLRGSVDIWGPDMLSSRNSGDKTYSIRRAIILRSLLEKHKLLTKTATGYKFKVTDSVLNALLCVSRFSHGTRSLEGIIQASQIIRGEEFTAAALPSDDRLGLQVNTTEFAEWLNGWRAGNEGIRQLIRNTIRDEIKKDSMQGTDGVTGLSLSLLEQIALSEVFSEHFSLFLDDGKAQELGGRVRDLTRDRPAIAKGVYDSLTVIKSKRGSVSQMLPWRFIVDQCREQDPPTSSWYHKVADAIVQALAPAVEDEDEDEDRVIPPRPQPQPEGSDDDEVHIRYFGILPGSADDPFATY